MSDLVSTDERHYQDRMEAAEVQWELEREERQAFIDREVDEMMADPFSLFVELKDADKMFNELLNAIWSGKSGRADDIGLVIDEAMRNYAKGIALKEWEKHKQRRVVG